MIMIRRLEDLLQGQRRGLKGSEQIVGSIPDARGWRRVPRRILQWEKL
jgi:hypothetical protein